MTTKIISSDFRKNDNLTAAVFGALILAFILLMSLNQSFFQWTFGRHHNVLSWYIRPLFLIPFCYFAYKRSLGGVMATMFLLLTSMFWFPKPEIVDTQVQEFLSMEKEYLTTNWSLSKILISLSVPVLLYGLALAFWKRSLLIGIAVMVLIAAGKVLWSVGFGSEAGTAVLVPALFGLLVCIALVFFGYKWLEKTNLKQGR